MMGILSKLKNKSKNINKNFLNVSSTTEQMGLFYL